MTKELSKQICEKCGIKPQYGYKCKLYDELHKKWEETVYLSKELLIQTIKFNPYLTSNYKVIKVEKFYPDFGKPENFVKLLELKFTHSYADTIMNILSLNYFCKDRKEFLEAFIEFLEFNNKYADNIKQSIRGAEWKYE